LKLQNKEWKQYFSSKQASALSREIPKELLFQRMSEFKFEFEDIVTNVTSNPYLGFEFIPIGEAGAIFVEYYGGEYKEIRHISSVQITFHHQYHDLGEWYFKEWLSFEAGLKLSIHELDLFVRKNKLTYIKQVDHEIREADNFFSKEHAILDPAEESYSNIKVIYIAFVGVDRII